MTKMNLKLVPAVSSLFVFSQVVHAQGSVQGQGRVVTDKPREEVVQRLEAKMDLWTEQAKKWAQKWQGVTREGAEDKAKQVRERICAATQDRVETRWQRYYDARMNRVQNMERGILTLQKRVEYFREKGLDTTKLEADIAKLQELVSEYKTAYADFLTALEEAKSIPCANYEGKFLPELKQAREAWDVVRAKARAIKDFYATNIKPDLMNLRSALEKKNLAD